MVLYNLILFAVIRYRIYLFYVLYQLGTFIHWSFIDGTSNQMIQDGITNPIGWRIFWAGFLAAAAILFAQTLLETRERNPFSHRILNIIFLLHLPFLIAPFFTGFLLTWSIQAVYLMSAVLYIPLLTVLISGAVKGFRPARLTLLCWGAFGVGAALSFLTQIGWLPSTAFTRNSMPIGVMIEAVLFSLILSGRFLEIRAEKESAQQEAIQNLTRADELKDRLLANTSHELRTPLHGIIGLAETIRDSSETKLAQSDFMRLDLVISNSKRLSNLVGDLLDLSALHDHRLSLQAEAFPLHMLVEGVLNLTEPLIREKSLRCLNQVSPDLPLVSADPNRIQQVLLNLVGNAVKYSDSGTVSISARAENKLLTVEVADTGSGIAPEELKRVFESFERGEKAEMDGGLGLGLSISQKLLQAHGSSLEVRSTPGKGSTFSFTLNVAEVKETSLLLELPELSTSPGLQPVQHPGHDSSFLSSQTESDSSAECILIVDDDPTNLEVASAHLSGLGTAFTLCLSGQEALDELDANPNIRLVLLDVLMPGLDGLEVCELIREKYSAEELPVLLLTALNQEEDIALGLQSGASDYLTKPLHKVELQARVAAHLDLARLRRQPSDAPRIQADNSRRMLVETMLLSLEIWEAQTEETVIDFAQKSKIWGSHLDRNSGTWRTRTLDQYLSVDTLPSKPRWRKVVQSAEFVLRECPADSDLSTGLQSQLDSLTHQLREHPLSTV